MFSHKIKIAKAQKLMNNKNISVLKILAFFEILYHDLENVFFNKGALYQNSVINKEVSNLSKG